MKLSHYPMPVSKRNSRLRRLPPNKGFDRFDGVTFQPHLRYDTTGDVTSLSDVFGNVKQRYVYDVYGQVTALTNTWAVTSDAYTWQYSHFDWQLDLYAWPIRNGVRDFNTTLGRWIEQDPVGYVDGGNLYEVCQAKVPKAFAPTAEGGNERFKKLIDEPKGTISVKTDVSLTVKGTNVGKGYIQFSYIGEQADKCVWFQMAWWDVVVIYPDGKRTERVPGKITVGISLPGKKVSLTTDTKHPNWAVDDIVDADTHYPFMTNNSLLDNEQLMQDDPAVPMGLGLATADVENYLDKVGEGWTATATTHLRAYLICNGKFVYGFDWHTTQTRKWGEAAGPKQTIYDGGKPNTGPDDDEIKAIKTEYPQLPRQIPIQ